MNDQELYETFLQKMPDRRECVEHSDIVIGTKTAEIVRCVHVSPGESETYGRSVSLWRLFHTNSPDISSYVVGYGDDSMMGRTESFPEEYAEHAIFMAEGLMRAEMSTEEAIKIIDGFIDWLMEGQKSV